MATISLPAPAARRAPRAAVRLSSDRTLVLERPAVAAMSSSSPSPIRLTRRGRRLARTVVIALALLLAITIGVLGRGAPVQAGDAPAQVATSTVVVQPGQTLWDVARSLSLDADVRETVARIQELNGLSDSALRPGQQLVVPMAG